MSEVTKKCRDEAIEILLIGAWSRVLDRHLPCEDTFRDAGFSEEAVDLASEALIASTKLNGWHTPVRFDDALAAQALDEGWCPGDDMGAYR